MTNSHAPKSLSIADPSETLALLETHLNGEQLECLSRCARGISVRFQRLEILDALVAGGYAERGVAGVVTVTAKGQQTVSADARKVTRASCFKSAQVTSLAVGVANDCGFTKIGCVQRNDPLRVRPAKMEPEWTRQDLNTFACFQLDCMR